MTALIPARDIVIMPGVETKINLGREFSINAAYHALKTDKKIVISIQKDVYSEKVDTNSIEEYGVLAEVTKIYKIGQDLYRLVLEGKKRVKLSNIIYNEELAMFETDYSVVKTIRDLDEEKEKENIEKIMKSISALIPFIANPSNNEELKILKVGSIEELLDNLIYKLPFEIHIKQSYLSIRSLKKRLESFYEDVKYESQRFMVDSEINTKLKDQIDENQRNYYLKEKIKVLKEELGEEGSEELENIYRNIEQKEMPKDFKEKLLKEYNKLKNTNNFSAEYNVILNYIETILDLPFYEKTESIIDIAKVKKILDNDHYGLNKVKDAILEYLSVYKLKLNNKTKKEEKVSSVICLLGPPGIGKTSFASSIARAMGREFIKISLGGVSDESEIRGHRRTYVGAMPGRIIEAIRRSKVSNPVILLDEIDKLDYNFKGDPASALLEVLDSSQNTKFEDRFIDFPYDLSNVLFICTANNYQTIPEPLYDRLEIIELESYTELEKLNIAKQYLIKQVEDETTIKLKLADKIILKIINDYTREAGVRNLKRELVKLARKIARKMLEENREIPKITIKNLTDYLGYEVYKPEKQSEKKPKIGVVTGLAWTSVGGTTLEVQAVKMEGDGSLLLTGKLGEVMQESAKVAHSYVRSIKKDLDIKEKFEKETDIHLHFPEGAVPKDGPSAGITITTAIISVLLNKGVRQDIAMTGEISITGEVLPVGGIKEKVIAAHRIGVREVILPYDNTVDTKELPKEILNEMKFNFVKNYDEVLKIVFDIK